MSMMKERHGEFSQERLDALEGSRAVQYIACDSWKALGVELPIPRRACLPEPWSLMSSKRDWR